MLQISSKMDIRPQVVLIARSCVLHLLEIRMTKELNENCIQSVAKASALKSIGTAIKNF